MPHLDFTDVENEPQKEKNPNQFGRDQEEPVLH